jgi:hypothetical protein
MVELFVHFGRTTSMHSLSRVVPLIGVILISSCFAQTGSAPAGHWEGTAQLPNRELQIMVDLAKDAKGAWTGTFGEVTGNVRDMPLADVKLDDKTLKFRIAAGGDNAPTFDCTLENASSMNCTLAGPGGSVPLPLKRTGEAKMSLPKGSPAVSAELEGNWEGTIETPNGNLRIVAHFKNQPDKTVKASLDSPDQNALDLPVTDVVQQGTAVEFQLRMVGGGYKGTLNKEATELTGQWSQGGNAVPLTLKKPAAK